MIMPSDPQSTLGQGMTLLAASLIRTDGGTQPRMLIDVSVVEDYADQIADGREFPPVVVFFDGSEYWLADGFHRYHAQADVLGIATINADVREGSQRDAILYSCGANAEHGLRRTNADKRRAVMVMLNDEAWARWSDREIARRCSVGHAMVSEMRPASLSSVDSERTYRTKHGTTSTMNVAGMRRRYDDGDEEEARPHRCPTCGQLVR